MYFTTDTVCGAVTRPTSDGPRMGTFTDAVTPTDFESARSVRLDSQAIEDAYGTRDFVMFDTIAARPIRQQYTLDGEEYTFKKRAEDLKRAAATLDGAPFPLEHPTTGVVRSLDQSHGFHGLPRYVEDRDPDGDALVVSTFVPANDAEAARYLDEHGGVSVGFYNDLDWTTDDDAVDAYQTDMYFDHIAAVEEGRCSLEDGCGVLTDSVTESISEMTTAARVSPSDAVDSTHEGGSTDAMSPEYDVGDWVQWEWRGGTAMGKIRNVSTESTLSSSGASLDPTEEGEPVYKIEHYDDEAQSFGNMKVATESDLTAVDDPTTDAEMTTAAGVTFRGTRDGTLDESAIPNDDYEQHYLYPADTKSDSSYPVVDADGYLRRGNVQAAHQLGARGGVRAADLYRKLATLNKQFDDPPIDEFTEDAADEMPDLTPTEAMQNAAQRVLDWRKDDDKTVDGMTDQGWARARQLASGDTLEPHDIVGGSDGMAPWWSRHVTYSLTKTDDGWDYKREDDTDPWKDNSYVAALGWGGISGAKWAIRKGNRIKEARGESANYSLDTADTMTDNDTDIDLDSFVEAMSLDSIAAKNDEVAEVVETLDDVQATLDEKESRIEVLEDSVETLEAETEDLEAELDEYRESEKEELVDEILDHTGAWDEEELMDESLDELETRLTVAEDAVSTASTPETTDSTDESSPTAQASTDDDGRTVSDEYRSWT